MTCTNGTYYLGHAHHGVFQRITMNVKNSDVCVYNVIPDMGNDDVGVRDVVMNGRSGCICVRSFWTRRISSGLHSSEKTHVKDLKDLVEVQPPGGNCLFVVLRVEASRDHTPFVPLE